MKFFSKNAKSKSYNTKDKPTDTSNGSKQLNQSEVEHKNLLSSPDSVRFQLSSYKPSVDSPNSGSPVKEDDSRAPSASNYLMQINLVDNEPEVLPFDETEEKDAKGSQNKIPKRTDKRNNSKKASDEIRVNSLQGVAKGNLKAQSLTDLGANDVEFAEKEIDKNIKVHEAKIDMKPISELEKPKIHVNEPPKDTAILINNKDAKKTTGNKKDEEKEDDKKKLIMSPETSNLLSPQPLENIFSEEGIPEERTPFNKRSGKRSGSVIYHPEGFASIIRPQLKRAASDIFFDKKKMNELTESSPRKKMLFKKHVTLSRRRCGKFISCIKPVIFIITYVLVVYGFLPLALQFGAFDYHNDIIRAVLNFGLLGFLQGIVQTFLLYHLIDVPILTKITEIEGKNKGLIDPSKYLTINKCNAVLMISFSTGMLIVAGVVIRQLNLNLTEINILLSILCITVFNGVIWLLFVWVKSPKALNNERKILEKELKEIGKIRKDFLEDLTHTRRKMEIKAMNQHMEDGSPMLINRAYLGLTSSVQSNMNVDARKLLHKMYDYSSEFARIRLQSIKTFTIMFLSILQILAMVSIIRLIEDTKNLPLSLLAVLFLFIVGWFFGLLDVFTPPTKPVLNTMKLVSLIVTAGAYRFVFIHITNRYKMIGVAVIKLLFKTFSSHFGVLFGQKIMEMMSRKKKRAIIDLYDSAREREATSLQYPMYMFQKFTVLQEVDLFFAIVSLLLNGSNTFWEKELGLQFAVHIGDYLFYVIVVVVEIGAHLAVGTLFIYLSSKIFEKKAKINPVNLKKEFMKIMNEKKWVVLSFKILVLYILLFIFFNDL